MRAVQRAHAWAGVWQQTGTVRCGCAVCCAALDSPDDDADEAKAVEMKLDWRRMTMEKGEETRSGVYSEIRN